MMLSLWPVALRMLEPTICVPPLGNLLIHVIDEFNHHRCSIDSSLDYHPYNCIYYHGMHASVVAAVNKRVVVGIHPSFPLSNRVH